jgi:hypothetical protein
MLASSFIAIVQPRLRGRRAQPSAAKNHVASG